MPARKSPQSAAAAPAAAPSRPAQDIWLAGLGALARAQAEGSKAFEALVKQGMEMQTRTQALAQEQMAQAAQHMQAMTQPGDAAATWNRLGGIFEERVAQALAALGMPAAQDLAALTARVQALERALGLTRRAQK